MIIYQSSSYFIFTYCRIHLMQVSMLHFKEYKLHTEQSGFTIWSRSHSWTKVAPLSVPVPLTARGGCWDDSRAVWDMPSEVCRIPPLLRHLCFLLVCSVVYLKYIQRNSVHTCGLSRVRDVSSVNSHLFFAPPQPTYSFVSLLLLF